MCVMRRSAPVESVDCAALTPSSPQTHIHKQRVCALGNRAIAIGKELDAPIRAVAVVMHAIMITRGTYSTEAIL